MGDEGGKARLDDRAKKHNSEAKDLQMPREGPDEVDQVDKLGSLARSSSERGDANQHEMENDLRFVEHSFTDVIFAAHSELEKLQLDLKKKDEPHWAERLAVAALYTALGAGAAGAGVFVASQFFSKAGDVKTEFVKMLFEGGVTAGIDAGKAKLSDGGNESAIEKFIISQKEGVAATHSANRERFIRVDRHKVRTVESSKALAAAFQRENVRKAARRHHDAARDAWVGYLAQSTFGAVATAATGSMTGRMTTDMRDQETRDQELRKLGRERKLDWSELAARGRSAPTLMDAVVGGVPGVLEVGARLPEINSKNRMEGHPTVHVALLNGVNDTIRSQYEGQPLASMKIPRQIVGKVSGGVPDFTVNLDEDGRSGELKDPEADWLRRRSIVNKPENAHNLDFSSNARAGLALLLEELVPRKIGG